MLDEAETTLLVFGLRPGQLGMLLLHNDWILSKRQALLAQSDIPLSVCALLCLTLPVCLLDP